MVSSKEANTFAISLILVLIFATAIVATTNYVSFENLQQIQHIKESMNAQVNPCDDFYAYACGNWSSSHLGNDYMNITTLLERKFESLVDKIIAERYPEQQLVKQQNQSFIEKAVAYYYSCKNRRDFRSLPYFHVIKPGENNEWPLLKQLRREDELPGKWNSSKPSQGPYDVFTILGDLFSYGLNNVLLNLKMKRFPNGSLIIELNTPERNDFGQYHIEQFLNQFEVSEEMWYKYLKDIKATHSLWHSICLQYMENKPLALTYNHIKISYQQIANFLETILPHQLRNDDVVVISHPKYIRYLLRKKWKALEVEKLDNYLMIQFHRYITENHISQCSRALLKRMHLAANYMYNQDIFLPRALENINAISQLFQRIYKHLLDILNENNLKLTPKQLSAIKDKLSNFNINIGNLPDLVIPSTMEEFYSHLPDFDIRNFVSNDLQLLKQRLWEEINCPKDMKCGPNTVSSITNFPADNLIIVPFATFIPPIHHLNIDPLFSISLLGTLIAHEFTHSIDPKFLSSDVEFRNFMNLSHIKDSLDCMESQEPIGLMGGRVADLLGARTAFRCYSMDYNEQPSLSTVPWQQLFFQNLAQYFCRETYGIAEERHRNVARLNDIAMNSEEFAKAFNCNVRSKMNPSRKCRFY